MKHNVPLSQFTTMGVGGAAKYFVKVNSEEEARKALTFANANGLPVFILGGGSNLIFPDSGFSGLVIQNAIQTFELIQDDSVPRSHPASRVEKRFHQQIETENYPESHLKSSWEESTPSALVRIGSGWKMNSLIQRCLKEQLTGLEWFGGIPGSVGGAVYMNMHGGSFFWSDFVVKLQVINSAGEVKEYNHEQLDFGYDYSVIQVSKEFILNVTVKLYQGNLEQAKQIFSQWARQKVLNQPQRSAGCIWQNLTEQEVNQVSQKLGKEITTPSVGYCIDKILKLAGAKVGNARISPQHAAFIENLGGASSLQVVQLIELVENKAQEILGISLKREVEVVS